MLASIVLFAAEEHESSKTAFYVAGAVLAVWAVAVAALGIKQHRSFPASRRLRDGIMALSAVLVAAVVASTILTA